MRLECNWHISAVEVKAFKSFSGAKWARFDVSDGFIGILGPNGSGKSNLLEAVCFATGCSSTLLRGCRALRDVTSTDAGSQLPGVKLEICRGKGSRAEHHVLETSLTPEGTRAYKIDGKNKTATQVKDHLRNCGVVIDSTTVIQQASVTRLSDSNRPATLADLVSAASGLASWEQETAAARQEILRTRKALKDIQTNISKIQSAAAADEAAVQANLEASRLERELERALQQLAAIMQQRQASVQQQLMEAQEQQQQTQAAADAAAEGIQQTSKHKQFLQTQQAQILADLTTHSSSATSSSSLAGQIAAAESKVAVLQANAAASSNLTDSLASCKLQLVQQEVKVQTLEGFLQAKLKVAGEAKAALAAVDLSSSAAESLHQQLLHMQKQAASVATAVMQQQAVVTSRSDDLQQARSRVAAAAAAANLQALPAGYSAAEDRAGFAGAQAAVQAAVAAAHAQQQTVNKLQQHLLQLQMDFELSESLLTSSQTAALLASCTSGTHGNSSNAAPLHACFKFKGAAAADSRHSLAQQQQQLLTPLSTIAGPGILQVLVADSMRHANTLLAAAAAAASGSSKGRPGSRGTSMPGKLKIWPLDNLRCYNNLPAQRAQQQLGGDKVVIPLDLFDYNKQREPAMIRAFGGFVIAADDAAAAQLVQRFGISSVTMQGTVSKKGSMSGGWIGSSGGSSGGFAKQFWTHKLQHDATAAQISAVQDQLQKEIAKQQQLEESRLQAEQDLSAVHQRAQAAAALQQQEAAAAAAEAQLQQEQQQLVSLQQQQANVQIRLQKCREAVDGNGSKGGAKAAAAAMKRQLKEDAARAAAAVQEVQQQLDEARDQVEQLSVQVETLELQLASTDSPEQQQDQLQQQQQHLQQLMQQQREQESATVQLQQQCQQLQLQVDTVEQELLLLKQQQGELQQKLRQSAADAAAAEADLRQLTMEKKQLLSNFPDSDVVQALATSVPAVHHDSIISSGGGSNANAGPPTAKQIQQSLRKVKQLQQQISALEVPEVPAAQRELCESRVQQVLQFKEQMAALEAAADGLEERISSTAEEVQAANDVVYEDIAAGFTQLCSSLLPALEVQLERTAKLAHEGLQIRFRRLEDTASTSSSEACEWQTSLGQLSGGQRTLVSLAMLLAVARAGNSSRLFLLDEVDAALDEHNQARAAALLKQLADAADGGCQILCVTHNPAFQQVCDAYIQVVRGPHGGTVPAAGAAKDTAATGTADNSKQNVAAGKVGYKAAGGTRRKTGTREGGGAARAKGSSASRAAKKVRFEM